MTDQAQWFAVKKSSLFGSEEENGELAYNDYVISIMPGEENRKKDFNLDNLLANPEITDSIGRFARPEEQPEEEEEVIDFAARARETINLQRILRDIRAVENPTAEQIRGFIARLEIMKWRWWLRRKHAWNTYPPVRNVKRNLSLWLENFPDDNERFEWRRPIRVRNEAGEFILESDGRGFPIEGTYVTSTLDLEEAIRARDNGWLPEEIIITQEVNVKRVEARHGEIIYPITERSSRLGLEVERLPELIENAINEIQTELTNQGITIHKFNRFIKDISNGGYVTFLNSVLSEEELNECKLILRTGIDEYVRANNLTTDELIEQNNQRNDKHWFVSGNIWLKWIER